MPGYQNSWEAILAGHPICILKYTLYTYVNYRHNTYKYTNPPTPPIPNKPKEYKCFFVFLVAIEYNTNTKNTAIVHYQNLTVMTVLNLFTDVGCVIAAERLFHKPWPLNVIDSLPKEVFTDSRWRLLLPLVLWLMTLLVVCCTWDHRLYSYKCTLSICWKHIYVIEFMALCDF